MATLLPLAAAATALLPLLAAGTQSDVYPLLLLFGVGESLISGLCGCWLLRAQ
jgi:hypothetical protein